ncbi:Hypothetical predicted protein [Marmota monax]|uniref:Uncharacterized protein n=1 Tax=Marmota monax TaxID=9995 RepID=A0A5E4B749_MARMO|nr:hypothetical protein GHT09_010249 [Marmota monax]VTJ64522.1 Hypothetical predicted protein [Marmota monax]
MGQSQEERRGPRFLGPGKVALEEVQTADSAQESVSREEEATARSCLFQMQSGSCGAREKHEVLEDLGLSTRTLKDPSTGSKVSHGCG